MEFELPSYYLLKDEFANKNNFDTFNETLDENLSLSHYGSAYIADHTVPVGWSYKGVGGSLRIKAPDGSDFRSR